jgi:DNA/RNA endonuclease YhcR with UshA esterase domain
MKKQLFVLLIFFSSFFILSRVFSANKDIVINEIAAYPTSTHEWLEIWNKGADAVDMTGWKFWENNTSHGLEASSTDAVVGPGEYAAVCQDSGQFLLDYPGFIGSVFDSSWGSLSESGEEIGLKDSSENFVEQFTYVAAPNYSLERADPFLADYSALNWQENANGHTLGLVNSNYLSAPTSSATSTPTTTPESGPPASPLWMSIKINEFVSNPESGNEWVELYNLSTSTLDLAGGYVCDSRNTTSTCKNLSGQIATSSWLVFDLDTDSYLNNDGDSVILKNSDGLLLDEISYSGALIAGKGQSLARLADGADADAVSDWAITTQITPALANIITAPPIPQSGSGGGGGTTPPAQPTTIKTTATTSVAIASTSVHLNELFPYPEEDDEEFVEIKNFSSSTVSLSGWKLADKVKSFTLSGMIGAGEIKYFDKTTTGIALNNSTAEEVRLIGPQGQVFESIGYEKAGKGLSYSRDANGKWLWTEKITLGMENIIAVPSVEVSRDIIGLFWRVKYKPLIRQNEAVVFDASKSLDPRGGSVVFAWDFGENIILFGNKPEYSFASSGLHEIIIKAASTAGTVDQKKIKINVYPAGEKAGTGVVLAEIAPNEDNNEEYIKIKNIGGTEANVSNWKIIANDKVFAIPTGTIIISGDILTFFKEITGFTLNNSGGQIELRTDEDILADVVIYGKASAGDKYVLAGDEWIFVKAPEEIATAKVSADKTAKTTSKKYVPVLSLSISQAREAEKDTAVKVRGIMAVNPGIFGSQYFYIVDEETGMQVYQYKKDFPELTVGDSVEVKGVISIASGVKRIKAAKAGDIDILSTGQNMPAKTADIGDINEDMAGALVKIAGEITEIKTNYMYIDDGTDEVMIYFKRGAKIDKKKFKEGELAEVTGIVEQAKSNLQLWPRSQEDIVITGASEDLLKTQAPVGTSSDTTEKYLTATAGGITTLFLGFLARARGAMLAGFFKKIGLGLAALIRRNKV